jgi:hypothetical protein
MTYEEFVSKIKGKPSKASLRVNTGSVTVRLDDVFMRSLEPHKILSAFDTTRDVSFRGRNESGVVQNATLTGKQVLESIGDHFGLSIKEEENKGKGKKSASDVGAAGVNNGQTVNA